MHRFEKVAQRGAIESDFGLVEVIEGIAEVDEHQVALVPEHGVGGEFGFLLEGGEDSGKSAADVSLT